MLYWPSSNRNRQPQGVIAYFSYHSFFPLRSCWIPPNNNRHWKRGETNGAAVSDAPTSCRVWSVALGHSGCPLFFFRLLVKTSNIPPSTATLFAVVLNSRNAPLFWERRVMIRFGMWSWRCCGYGLKSLRDTDAIPVLFRTVKNLCPRNTPYGCPSHLA